VAESPCNPTAWIAALLIAASCASAPPAVGGTASPVRIAFVAQSDSFADAAREYQRLWDTEGARIVAAMERISGLRFTDDAYADTAITAHVAERASFSGYRERPMLLRASYPLDTKRATLIHELGHRLQADLFRRDEEPHPMLFHWIYSVWVELYGAEFAAAQVEVEKRRGPRYVEAWNAALAHPPEERLRRWRAFVTDRR
jgi:hypothetical protein